MRPSRPTPTYEAWPSVGDARGCLLGLPFVLTAFSPGPLLGWWTCVGALAIASMASFVVYVPVTVLALNGGKPLAEDTPAPALPVHGYATLLALWTMTVWVGAAIAPHLH